MSTSLQKTTEMYQKGSPNFLSGFSMEEKTQKDVGQIVNLYIYQYDDDEHF